MINIYQQPMVLSEIKIRRLATNGATVWEDSNAGKVMKYCPIPVIDILASLALTALTNESEELKDWRDVPGALDRDWSATKATSTYVALVVAQGRDLVKAEIDVLQRHLDLIANADYAIKLAREIAKKASQ